MSSIHPNNSSTENRLKDFALALSKPVSAGAAIMPTVYGFIAKSALQIGERVPRITLRKAPSILPSLSVTQLASEGVKASPKIGAAIGTQMIAQKQLESLFNNGSQNQTTFSSKLLSSAIVGAISSPFLIAFNAQTIGTSFFKSLRRITPSKVATTTGRETAFVFSLAFSDPFAKKMREYKDTKTTEKIAYFISGYVGSIIGHPGDTILTLLQKGKGIKPPSLSSLNKNTVKSFASVMFRGGNTKAITVGVFSIIYNSCYNFINRNVK